MVSPVVGWRRWPVSARRNRRGTIGSGLDELLKRLPRDDNAPAEAQARKRSSPNELVRMSPRDPEYSRRLFNRQSHALLLHHEASKQSEFVELGRCWRPSLATDPYR